MSLKGDTVLIFQNVKRCLQRSWGGLLETNLTIFSEIKPQKNIHTSKNWLFLRTLTVATVFNG